MRSFFMGNRPMVRENKLSYPLFHMFFYVGVCIRCAYCNWKAPGLLGSFLHIIWTTSYIVANPNTLIVTQKIASQSEPLSSP
jgi:hypothetical protein